MAISATIAAVGVVSAGATLGAGAIAAGGATSAAQTQANAAIQNQNAILAAGGQASGMDIGAIAPSIAYLQPYQDLGTSASGTLKTDLAPGGSLTQGFNPTMAELASLPGYQFELQQGLEATQNGFAARGLGSSGAAIKGGANYAQGLAANDYNNYANIFYTNQNNAYNRLMGATQVGATAGANMGQLKANLTQAGANALMGSATNAASLGMAGAAASAAGTVGAANAYSNALTGSVGTLGNAGIAAAVLGGSNSVTGYSPFMDTGMYGGNPLVGTPIQNYQFGSPYPVFP